MSATLEAAWLTKSLSSSRRLFIYANASSTTLTRLLLSPAEATLHRGHPNETATTKTLTRSICRSRVPTDSSMYVRAVCLPVLLWTPYSLLESSPICCLTKLPSNGNASELREDH